MPFANLTRRLHKTLLLVALGNIICRTMWSAKVFRPGSIFTIIFTFFFFPYKFYLYCYCYHVYSVYIDTIILYYVYIKHS